MSDKDDCISRRDAIEAIEKAKMAQTPDGEIFVAKYNTEMNIQLLPSVQPEPHWIPCSERLPKETGEYLVTKISIGWNCKDYTENDIAYWDNHKGFCKAEKVIAWMPILEPYRGGDSE